MAHCSQFLVDGPCYVLFLRELQQPGINRCISGLCWVVDPLMYVATYCGPIVWLIAAVLSIIRDARDIKRSDCGTDILPSI